MFSVLLGVWCVWADEVFDVDSFGAKADGKTVNTAAFREASAAAQACRCKATVLASSPGVYLTGAFNLTSDTTLNVTRQTTVRGVASNDTEAFPIIPFLPSYGKTRDDNVNGGINRYQALVMTYAADNVKILGGGVLDGNGQYWWDARSSNKLYAGRPHLVEFYNSSNVEIGPITLLNSAFWTLHPVYSRDVWIHDVDIQAPSDSPNTDGIDPDSSSNVLIEDCRISMGDDHIAIKSGIDKAGQDFGMASRNITVRGNVHLAGRGISIGSEVSGGVEGVTIENVMHLGPSEHGIHIKTAASRGGYVRDVLYRNITVGQVQGDKVLSLETSYGQGLGASSSSAAQQLTDIRNIRYEGISRGGTSIQDKGAGQWKCFGSSPCFNISLQNVNLEPAKGWTCRNVDYATSSVFDVSPAGLTECFKS